MPSLTPLGAATDDRTSYRYESSPAPCPLPLSSAKCSRSLLPRQEPLLSVWSLLPSETDVGHRGASRMTDGLQARGNHRSPSTWRPFGGGEHGASCHRPDGERRREENLR